MNTGATMRVVEHHLVVLTKWWRSGLIFSTVSPLLFLAAMGVGLGTLVGDGGPRPELAGLTYLQFVGPGLLAASVMQVASGESMWPIMGGLKWQKTWHAMLATPLSVDDVVAGQFIYEAIRLAVGGLGYLVMLGLFGVIESPWAILALPAAVLCGMAFATPISAFTATQDGDQGFIVLFRVFVMPVFLFSGAFFPIEQLPSWLEWLAKATPLWHGIELVRGLVLGRLGGVDAATHIAYLSAWVAAGWLTARVTFRRRMVS